MENVKGLFTGETDKTGVRIYYETSRLKFPDGTFGKIMFDTGQLCAYYAKDDNGTIERWDGINNANSVYLRDCLVVDYKNEIISAFAFKTGKQIEELIKEQTENLSERNHVLECRIHRWYMKSKDAKFAKFFGLEK